MVEERRYGTEDLRRIELWDRFRSGESISEIGRALNRTPAAIFTVVRRFGGLAPASRRRSPRALSLAEREEISRGLADGESLRAIGRRIGRPASTVLREVRRNGGSDRYRAWRADEAAWRRAQRPKTSKLASHARLRKVVAAKLQEDWSPQQISGWLRIEFAHDETMRVSHEAIYQTLFVQARGALKKELTKHLRTRRPTRRSKRASAKGQNRGAIQDLVSIRERPPEVEDRAVPGHWEGDMLSGSKNSHVATLVERKTRYLMLLKLPAKDASTVAAVLTRRVKTLPSHLKRSLTWDRGPEMAAHVKFTIATDVKVYFCDPQSPWQRGSNENTNGLLTAVLPSRHRPIDVHPTVNSTGRRNTLCL